VNGIKFWSYNAGHVLGAAMFMIEIAGVKIFYTGDFSCEEDRHLMAAEVPAVSPDILISVTGVGYWGRVECEAVFLLCRRPRLAHMSMSPERRGSLDSLVCVATVPWSVQKSV
jgi:hypothetical protein